MFPIDIDDLAERIRDEVSGFPIGDGYYQTTVANDEAWDMTEDIMSVITPFLEEAYKQGQRDVIERGM